MSIWSARDDVYHTCRTLLVHRQDQIALFDRAFAAFWRIHTEGTAAGPKRRDGVSASIVEIEQVLAPGDIAESDSDAAEESEPAVEVGIKTWSDLGGLRDKDFAAFSADEIARARIALARLVWNPASAGRDAGCRPAVRASTCAARSPTACALAATSSRCGAGCGGSAPGRSSCFATSADRWIATAACCCTSRTRSRRAGAASRRSSSPPG
jgi:hypothetical protein